MSDSKTIKDAQAQHGTPVASAQSTKTPSKPEKVEAIKGDEIMIFSRGDIYHGLRITEEWNHETGEYDPPAPKQTVLFDGTFVEMTIDPEVVKAYGEFLIEYSKVIDGLKMAKKKGRVVNDVSVAMELTKGFRK